VQIRPTEFKISDLFAALRGMLKPLLAANSAVQLNFEWADDLPVLETDEGKVSQILRNFISNALKFTERGEVLVSARHDSAGTVVLAVPDTGIGIAEKDQERVFEEFGQVDSNLQKRSKGTGLGLPLSRKLASLLGGSVMLKSEPGRGSTFSVVLPVTYRGPDEAAYIPDLTKKIDPTRAPVLVIEDNRESLFVYEKYLKSSGFQVIPARTLREARIALGEIKPVAIIADILLEGENTWAFIADLKTKEETRHIPILVVTMIDNEKKARNVGADAFHTKPVERAWLVSNLLQLTQLRPRKTLLMIDDDDVSRYIVRSLLAHSAYRIVEAVNGLEGIRLAREEAPSAILLDLSMPEMNGFETIAALKADPATSSIPVIIHSSRPLNESETHDLEKDAIAILPKEAASRETAASRLTLALKKAGLEEGAAS
jgi:CheY-like chemotaxis protein